MMSLNMNSSGVANSVLLPSFLPSLVLVSAFRSTSTAWSLNKTSAFPSPPFHLLVLTIKKFSFYLNSSLSSSSSFTLPATAMAPKDPPTHQSKVESIIGEPIHPISVTIHPLTTTPDIATHLIQWVTDLKQPSTDTPDVESPPFPDLSLYFSALPLSYRDFTSRQRIELDQKGVQLWNACCRAGTSEDGCDDRMKLHVAQCELHLLITKPGEVLMRVQRELLRGFWWTVWRGRKGGMDLVCWFLAGY